MEDIHSFFKKANAQRRGMDSPLDFGLSFKFSGTQAGHSIRTAMNISAVYRCVEVISDSLAQLPIEPFIIDSEGYRKKAIDHPCYWILNREPNHIMSRYTFIKTLVTSVLLSGNGYALITRERNGNIKSLRFLDPTWVTLQKDTLNGKLSYKVTGVGTVEPCNMIHILNFSYDGFEGISTISAAAKTLGIAHSSENMAESFFTNGCNNAGLLVSPRKMTPEQKNQLKQSWYEAFNGSNSGGNGIGVLDNTDANWIPLTINPVDSQLLESRKWNVIDICRFFGVNPVKVFDLSNSSYSTVEATQLAFLTDTLSPLIEKFELEFERKLFLPSERNHIDVKFDTSTLLKADKTAQATFYRELYNIGAITPNEIRKELNLEPKEGGDSIMTQVNMATIKSIEENPALDSETSNQIKTEENGTESEDGTKKPSGNEQ